MTESKPDLFPPPDRSRWSTSSRRGEAPDAAWSGEGTVGELVLTAHDGAGVSAERPAFLIGARSEKDSARRESRTVTQSELSEGKLF